MSIIDLRNPYTGAAGANGVYGNPTGTNGNYVVNYTLRTGGSGGYGGHGGHGGSGGGNGGDAGGGGSGGAGVSLSGGTLTNEGTITGGNGGTGRKGRERLRRHA